MTEKFEYYLSSAFLSLGFALTIIFFTSFIDLGYYDRLIFTFTYFLSGLLSTLLICRKIEEPLLLIGLKMFILLSTINVTANAFLFRSYAGTLLILTGLFLGISIGLGIKVTHNVNR